MQPPSFDGPQSPIDQAFILGESGIRTHERLTPSAVFKTAAFNRSAISPRETNRLHGNACDDPDQLAAPTRQALSSAKGPEESREISTDSPRRELRYERTKGTRHFAHASVKTLPR